MSKSHKKVYDYLQKMTGRSSENNTFMLRQPSSQYTGTGFVGLSNNSYLDSSVGKVGGGNTNSIHSENGNVYR